MQNVDCKRRAVDEHSHLELGKALQEVTDGTLHGDSEASVKLADHVVAALAIMSHNCAQAAQDNAVLLIQHSLQWQHEISLSQGLGICKCCALARQDGSIKVLQQATFTSFQGYKCQLDLL